MKPNKKQLDAIIENATRSIREEQVDPSAVNESAARVWARISQETGDATAATSNFRSLNTMNHNDNTEHISGCGDFQSLIPAYLKGELSAARTLLLEDHSNECIPCRKELKVQRAGTTAPVATERKPVRKAASVWRLTPVMRLGFAAAALVIVGLVGMFAYERLDLSGRTTAAT